MAPAPGLKFGLVELDPQRAHGFGCGVEPRVRAAQPLATIADHSAQVAAVGALVELPQTL
jgi:hypothetical protein